MGLRVVLIIMVLLSCVSTAGALSTYQPLPPPESERTVIELHRRLAVEHREARLDDALHTCRELLTLIPGSPVARYNLACVLARQGKRDAAFTELGRAVAEGWDDPIQTRSDADLAGLVEDGRWPGLLQRIATAHPPLITSNGQLRTILGTCSVGLDFRLVSPLPKDGAVPRLVVWLHPTGESGLELIEPLVPMLSRHGLALLVFVNKSWDGWTPEDQRRLLNTLRWLHNLDDIDPQSPILFGYSAGGQTALELWRRHPEWFGGLVLCAAYPIDSRYAPVGSRLLNPPDAPAVHQVPILAFVGGIDPNWAFWTQAEQRWAGSGVPLTVTVVPGKGHVWLIGSNQLRQLEHWLDHGHYSSKG